MINTTNAGYKKEVTDSHKLRSICINTTIKAVKSAIELISIGIMILKSALPYQILSLLYAKWVRMSIKHFFQKIRAN